MSDRRTPRAAKTAAEVVGDLRLDLIAETADRAASYAQRAATAARRRRLAVRLRQMRLCAAVRAVQRSLVSPFCNTF